MQEIQDIPNGHHEPVAASSPVKLDPSGGALDPLTQKRGLQVALLAALERSSLPADAQLAILFNLVVATVGAMPETQARRGKVINAVVKDFQNHLQRFLPRQPAGTPAPGTPRLG